MSSYMSIHINHRDVKHTKAEDVVSSEGEHNLVLRIGEWPSEAVIHFHSWGALNDAATKLYTLATATDPARAAHDNKAEAKLPTLPNIAAS